MSQETHLIAARNAMAAEQIKAFFAETSAQNLAGVIVLCLVVWAAADMVPLVSWAPALAVSCVVSLWRARLIHAYHRNPEAKTPKAWGNGQTLSAAINGTAWGLANTAMCVHLPLPYQLFIATVCSVSASAAASEGFAYFRPSLAFICTSLTPLTVFFLYEADHLHLILGVMLSIYIPVLIWQGGKRHRAFNDSLELRFRNEYLAKELAQLRQIAEDASRAKARFLAAASHDLRQPVQALAIFHELVRPEMQLTAKGEDYFAKAQQAVSSVSSLLKALLDVAKLESSTVEMQHRVISVSSLLADLKREFAQFAEQKGVRLRVAHCSAHLDTDPLLLGQILRNLLANALHYTESGKVLLGCRRRGALLEIAVWDTGLGICEEHQRLIFDEFFQVGNKARDRQQGLGLGLAIADRAATLLGAKISLQSQLGRGSCFSIQLPITREPLPLLLGTAAQETSPFDLDNRLVVVVENEEDIRSGIHKLLENWGCGVISGPTGASILAQIEDLELAGGIDAIISDFGLPGDDDGIEVIRKLRSRLGSQTPALLVTGDTSKAAAQAASQAGIRMLHKPLRPWLLRKNLCAVITPMQEAG